MAEREGDYCESSFAAIGLCQSTPAHRSPLKNILIIMDPLLHSKVGWHPTLKDQQVLSLAQMAGKV